MYEKLQLLKKNKIMSKREERIKKLVEALKYIDLGNELAKINKEDRAFLYKAKHDFLEFIVSWYPELVTSKVPAINGNYKLLEISLIEGAYIFHVPCKSFIDFNPPVTPVIYNPKKIQNNNLDRNDICRKLFKYYRECLIGYPSSGKVRDIYIKSGTVKFWYAREIVRLEYGENYELTKSGITTRDNNDCKGRNIFVIFDPDKNEVRRDRFDNILFWALELYSKYF